MAGECNVCGCRFDNFIPGGVKTDSFAKYHVIGGGFRENYKCPFCDAIDRERFLHYVMKVRLNISEASGRVLHFAPEACIKQLIQSNAKIDYYTGDIVPKKAMHITDITDMQRYGDEAFDYVICNHVMEHILDEKRAMTEIKRVLKRGGKLIFSVPVCMDIDVTYEDETITEPEERLVKYGQKDHVRLYGRDFLERFKSYGLKITKHTPKDSFSSDEIERFGLIEDDVIMVAVK